MTEKSDTIPVSLTDLIELAVEFWRVEKSFQSETNVELSVRYFSRQFQVFLEKYELRLLDMTGKIYEEGLAIEVVDVVEEDKNHNGQGIIDEMVSPVILRRDVVVRHGKAVLRKTAE